jgi:1,4-dihydroxy-2-naphthoate octaprenyltransferase
MTGEKQATQLSIGSIFDHDTVLHLRIPFSFFLLPVFCYGISQATTINLADTVIVFIALHLFIYPGSNVYNSFMDKDTGSIGGLEKPPPVTLKLYYASIIFDTVGLLLCAVSSWQNAVVMAGYVAFSKAYSWHGIRLKKYPYLAWASVMFFQGGYTFMLANMAAEHSVNLQWFTSKNIECMIISSLLIGGFYPLTQIYQHDEDSQRGDFTISYRLGITGTFIFTAVLFLCGTIISFHYFTTYYQLSHFLIFLTCLLPAVSYFAYWFIKTIKNKSFADYHHAMRMNKVASICMIICFTIILYINHSPLSY